MVKFIIPIPVFVPAFIQHIGVRLLLCYRKRHYDVAFRRIPLTQGQYALVDQADFESLNQFKWCAAKDYETFYAIRYAHINNKNTTIKMHRQIMNAKENDIVDHRDKNGLNNTRENLRIATASQNNANSKRGMNRGKSKYKGVCRDERCGKWRAGIKCQGKHIHLGMFDDEIKAAKAYDEAAKKYHGEFAVLNFTTDPDEIVQGTSHGARLTENTENHFFNRRLRRFHGFNFFNLFKPRNPSASSHPSSPYAFLRKQEQGDFGGQAGQVRG